MDAVDDIYRRIPQAMLQDQFWLRREAKRIGALRRQHQPVDQRLERLYTRLEASRALRQSRGDNVPQPEFDLDLPIIGRRQEIAAVLKDHQVVVVAGETGSGKSTQLPKICLDAGFGIAGMIGHTQPRRLAARSVAARVAEELGSPMGKAVGYKIRFQDKTDPETYIKLMTDGILLAEAAGDRFLEQYEVIILDEAHERSLNIDFLIGMLANLVRKRDDLRVIITSATIDAARFAEHFATAETPAPVIEVEGRTYPVEVRYRPLEREDGDARDMYEGIIAAVHELSSAGGDMLVFLPTERDIREAAKRLRGDKILQQSGRVIDILPLYARLSTAEQNRIFRPGRTRRIVLATNVAESSLTVPRIHSVIDTGMARISRYSPRLRMQRLPIEPISQASAEQRKGRCGRIGPGICVRLFAEEDFAQRQPFTTPEIRRTNLASVILQAKHLNLGEVDQIPLLEAPRPETVREGYKTLFELGAVDDHRRLTKLGRALAKLPVDPRMGRMILAADQQHCLAELLIIAAALEVQDPRLRPLEQQQAADQQHARFVEEHSDFMSFLKLWDYVQQQRQTLSRSRFRRLCQREFLSEARLREWGEIHRQLRQTAEEHGLRPRQRRDDYAAIHRALLTGLLSRVAQLSGEHQYTGAGGTKFQLWPGSALFSAKPKWIVAAEVVETRRRYGRTVAKIDPRWLEPLGQHLVKRTYSDPHWHAKSLSVMAHERVSLFGLPVVARRRVPYGKIDPATSRKLFIEHALVSQEMEARDDFFQHNRRLRAEAATLAAKTRRRDYILDEYQIYAFYHERLPEDAFDMASLRGALKKNRQLRSSLRMSLDDLVPPETSSSHASDYPEQLDVGSMQLPLDYRFEPGTDEDGVTVTVPTEAISQVLPEHLEWLVPGLVEEKLIALIRSLPKATRRELAPATETARHVAQEMTHGRGAFLQEAARRLGEIAQQRIGPQDFRLDQLPVHLQMRVRVVDSQGDVVAAGRDLQRLRQQHTSPDVAVEPLVDTPETAAWHRDGLTCWDFGTLPGEVRVQRGDIELVLYPALIEQGEAVGIRLLDTAVAANRATRLAVRQLYHIANRRALRSQVRWLPRWDDICLWASSLMPKADLEQNLRRLLADRAFLADDDLPRTQEEFDRRQQEGGQRIAVATQELAAVIPALMESYHQCQLALEKITASRWQLARDDVQHQLTALLSNDFLVETPRQWLQSMPRYLQAIDYRIDKLIRGGQARDEANVREVAKHWTRYQASTAEGSESASCGDALSEYRWMIEEFRVSLFAQPLGTSIKVSPQRLDKLWHKIAAGQSRSAT